QQMCAIKTRAFGAFNQRLHRVGNVLRLRCACSISNGKLEGDAPQIHALVVLYGLLEQLGIAAHDLLTAQAAYTGSLQAHMLYAASDGPHHNEVAGLEWLVQADRYGRKQIAKYYLCRQRHCNTAYAQARDKGGDIHTHIV